jgi:hypothetical protein
MVALHSDRTPRVPLGHLAAFRTADEAAAQGINQIDGSVGLSSPPTLMLVDRTRRRSS